jgi:predicted nucleic acid-binding protein
MPGKILIDTNVLIYAFDSANLVKQKKAVEVLRSTFDGGIGLLSAQVLGEFFTIVTRKIQDPLTIPEARVEVERFFEAWSVVPITELVVIEAIRGVEAHHLSYWDAQVWASALLNQASLVLSEDFQDGQVIEGIRFANPFQKEFVLETLVGR